MHYCILVGFDADDASDTPDRSLLESHVDDAMRKVVECPSCGNGYFDWWALGGRFKGMLVPGYRPEDDPDHKKCCTYCDGTGVRPGGLEQFGQEWFDRCNGCNVCHGTGVEITWPTSWLAHPEDIVKTAGLADRLPKDTSYTVLGANGLEFDVPSDVALEILSEFDWVAVADGHA